MVLKRRVGITKPAAAAMDKLEANDPLSTKGGRGAHLPHHVQTRRSWPAAIPQLVYSYFTITSQLLHNYFTATSQLLHTETEATSEIDDRMEENIRILHTLLLLLHKSFFRPMFSMKYL